MHFQNTKIADVLLINLQKFEDERGFFARTWCHEELTAHGLNTRIMQCSISFNKLKGTLRGMHYQRPPHEETKVVRCTMGAIYDVVVDLRESSPTFLQWEAFELSAENRHMLYVPEGLAHGFQTLIDHAEVFYQISEFHHVESVAGVRYNDPAFGIEWPLEISCISEKDRNLPFWEDKR